MIALARFRAGSAPPMQVAKDDVVANDDRTWPPRKRPRPLSARRAIGRVAQRAKALEGLGPARRSGVVLLPFPRISLDRLSSDLSWRPAVGVIGLALLGALLVHVAFGGWGMHLRPHKARAARIAMAVAAEAPIDPIEELPADDTPPAPPPPTTTPRAAAPSAPSAAPSAARALGPLVPGLTPLHGAGGGAGMQIGDAAAGGTASSPEAPPPREPRIEAPRARTRPAPAYPRGAREQRIEGHVTLQILVGADGRARDVRVLDSQPAGVFDDAALAAARRFTFEPGRSDGRPVEAWVRQVVRFALD